METLPASLAMFSFASAANRASMESLPEELPKAWLHFLMAFIFASDDKHQHKFQAQSEACRQLLLDGVVKTLFALKQKTLLEYLAFVPSNLASLINFALIQDITGQNLDTSETYFEYLSNVVSHLL